MGSGNPRNVAWDPGDTGDGIGTPGWEWGHQDGNGIPGNAGNTGWDPGKPWVVALDGNHGRVAAHDGRVAAGAGVVAQERPVNQGIRGDLGMETRNSVGKGAPSPGIASG